jgi:hypothetical protein
MKQQKTPMKQQKTQVVYQNDEIALKYTLTLVSYYHAESTDDGGGVNDETTE